MHLRAEGAGRPVTLVLTPGQQHEATVFERLREQGAVRRPGRGRPRLRPRRIVGDKGYTGRARRAYCRRRGLRYTIPRLSSERRRGPFDRTAYRRRHLIENLFAHTKRFRALATRYDKTAASFHAAWTLVCTLLWLPK